MRKNGRVALGCCLTAGALFCIAAILLAVLVHHNAGVAVAKDIVYGEAGSEQLKLDVYRPMSDTAPGAKAVAMPAVVMIHGGGWEQGSKADMGAFSMQLAKKGFVCFAVDYRLMTDQSNRFPAQIDDAQRAVRWIRANAKQYGVDPNHIGAFGHSAGAHLAALLGTTDTRDNSDSSLAAYSSRVQCVVDTGGPVDFTDPAHPPLSPATMALVPKLFGVTQEQAPALFLSASPACLVDHKSAPFLILHGTQDTLVPMQQAEHMADALRKADIEVRLLRVEDQHLFAKPDNLLLWLNESVAFLHKHLH
jgi:acetyl esterase/lipase